MDYIILDFGDVIFYPTTGDWFLTPYFHKVVDLSKYSDKQIAYAKKCSSPILGRHAEDLNDEYELFFDFYKTLLETLNYEKLNNDLLHGLAYDYTYNSTKCYPYEGIYEELRRLSKKYQLIMLTDNWPCCYRLMKEHKLSLFFKKIYVSSYYDCLKQDGIFFDYPINDFNIKKAIFVDDKEINLNAALKKGMDVYLMDRTKTLKKSKYSIINSLNEIR